MIMQIKLAERLVPTPINIFDNDTYSNELKVLYLILKFYRTPIGNLTKILAI